MNSVTCILGVDPGVSGATAFYFPTAPERVAVEDMPTVAREVDTATLAQRIGQMAPDLAIVELVNAMPKQGVVSTFRFGVSYGAVRGVISAIGVPVHLVAPSRWKRHFGLNAEKEAARGLALRFWPTSEHFGRKKDHGRAEAALLARYGAERVLRGMNEHPLQRRYSKQRRA
jgi:hypothetical protein